MRSIEVDDDIYYWLRGVGSEQHISPSEILRGLISRGPVTNSRARGPKAIADSVPGCSRSPSRDQLLLDYVQGARFRAHRQSVDRFLGILEFVHAQDPQLFFLVVGLGGRKRKYFGKTEAELDAAGTSVNAKKVPGSEFWVVTNNSTRDKGKLLEDVLTLMGYQEETVRQVVRLFTA